MSRPSRADEKPIQGSRRRLATAGIILAVFLFTMAGAWAEARWPRGIGTYITGQPRGAVQARDLLAQLKRVDGVRDAVAVFQSYLATDDIEDTGWREVRIFANQTNNPALAFLPPDPTLSLYRGRLPDVHSLDETIVGYEFAQAMQLSIGDTLTLRERRFTVAGIWGPSASLPGNWVQVSVTAVESLASSSPLSVHAYLALPAPGEDTEEIAARIWNKVPSLKVVSPQWEMAHAEQVRRVLLLAVSSAALLLCLLCLPLLADLAGQHCPSLVAMTISAALAGLAIGCGACFLANLYTRHALGLTAFRASPRLGVLAVALAGGVSLLASWMGRSFARPLRYALTTLTLALCGAGWVLTGTLSASLHASLAEAQRTAADWITVPGVRADAVLLRDLARLPGIRGYAIEAYGGLANEEEDRWLGPWPSSGVFYGVEFAGGEGTLSVPYLLGFWQGRPLDPGMSNEAVVGYGLAQRHGLQIGDSTLIRDVPFTVVGIRAPLLRDPLSDANYRLDISLEAFRRAVQDPFATGELTLLIPPANSSQDKAAYLSEVRARLNAAQVLTVDDRLAKIARSYPAAWTLIPASSSEAVRHARSLYAAAVLICGLLLSAAGALAVADAMADLLDRDTLRLGLLKAVGMDEGTLLGEYLQIAAVLGAVGALLGVLGGWAAASWLNRGAESLHLFAGAASRSAQLFFTPSLGASVFFVAVLTAMAAAVAPVSHSIRQDITPALYSAAQEPLHPGALSAVSVSGPHGGSRL